MDAIKVGEDGAIRLDILKPGDYYHPEIISLNEIKLRRIESKRMSRLEALRAIESSQLNFSASWDEIRQETRE